MTTGRSPRLPRRTIKPLFIVMFFLLLQLIVIPYASGAPITITITELDSPTNGNVITVNFGGANFTLLPTMLTLPPVGQPGWDISTKLDASNSFTFGAPFLGPTFYFAEPDPATANVLTIATTTDITVVSDFSVTGVPVISNATKTQIGSDTLGNAVSVVFIDNLSEPHDMPPTPEPPTVFLLLISSVFVFFGFTRHRSSSGPRFV